MLRTFGKVNLLLELKVPLRREGGLGAFSPRKNLKFRSSNETFGRKDITEVSWEQTENTEV